MKRLKVYDSSQSLNVTTGRNGVKETIEERKLGQCTSIRVLTIQSISDLIITRPLNQEGLSI